MKLRNRNYVHYQKCPTSLNFNALIRKRVTTGWLIYHHTNISFKDKHRHNPGKDGDQVLSAGDMVKPNTVCQPVCDSSARINSGKGPGKSQGKKAEEKKQDPGKGGKPNNPLAAYVNHPNDSPLLKWSGKSIKCR